MGMGNTYKEMVQYIEGCGKTTNKKEKEWRYGKIKPDMKVIFRMDKNTVKENWYFKMVRISKAILNTIL